jgi:hypothetical protein
VGRPRLANAIGLGYIAIHSSSILGPTLAGYSIATIGAAASLCVAATLFLIGALAAAAISAPAPTAKARPTSTLASLAEGLVYLRHHPQLSGLLGTGIAFVLFGATPFRLMPVFAQDIYQVGAVGLGLLLPAPGVVSVLGAFPVATLGDALRKGQILLAAGLLTGATSIAFSATSSFTAGLGLLLIAGIARGTYLSLNSTLLQTISSDEMRGRVVGLYAMTWGLMPLSLIPLGATSDAFGPRLTVGGTGALLLLLMTVAASLRSQLRDLP